MFTKKNLLVFFILSVVFSYFGYRYLLLRDFDIICESTISALDEHKDEDKSIKAHMVSDRISDNLVTPSVRDAFNAIAPADPKTKYELLLIHAKDVGYPSWQCPRLQSFLME